MALLFFLEIPGIPGDSTFIRFENDIELLSYSLGFSHPLRSNVTASPLVVTKRFDSASVPLFSYLFQGTHIPQMFLFVAKSGEVLETLLKITFNDVTVLNLNQSAQQTDIIPLEDVEFDYAAVAIESNIFGALQRATFDKRSNRP